jgi:hypothetical protein
MMTSPLGPRRGGWRRPVSLPADLAELRGPLTGWCGCPWVCTRLAKGQRPRPHPAESSGQAQRR